MLSEDVTAMGLESTDLGENDCACESERGVCFSNAAENDNRLVECSDPLSSSGRGITCARSKELSSSLFSGNDAESLGGDTPVREVRLPLRDVSVTFCTGRACKLLRIDDGVVAVVKGDEMRRLKLCCSGEGGEIERPDNVRECDGGTMLVLTDRLAPFETIRDLGEGGDVDVRRGDAGRAVERW